MTSLRRLAVWGLCCGLLVASGCGGGGAGKPAAVEGKIYLENLPLTDVTIVFTPSGPDGQPAAGRSGSDGSFRLTTRNTGDGAVPGLYKVTVQKANAASGPGAGGMADTKGPDYANKMKDMIKQREKRTPQKTAGSEIHSNYTDAKKTPLQFEIPPGGNKNLKIELNKNGS